MLNRHLYHFREGRTDLGAETFNPIFTDLDARLHKLETLKISWLEAVTELRTFGLERINGALEPALDQITALLVEATAEHETLLLSTTAAHEALVQDNADLIESATTFQAELEAWKVAYIKEVEEGGGGGGFKGVIIVDADLVATEEHLHILVAVHTITLPANPSENATVSVFNKNGGITSGIDPGSRKINGINELLVIDSLLATVNLFYSGPEYGWILL